MIVKLFGKRIEIVVRTVPDYVKRTYKIRKPKAVKCGIIPAAKKEA